MKIRKIFSTITVLAMLGSAISGISALADNAQNQITPANASGQLKITLEIKEPATAAYEQVGEDYQPQFAGDTAASLWTVTVKAGTDSIDKIDVKLGNITSTEGEQAIDGPTITAGEVVLGVITNLSGSDVAAMGGFTVEVNDIDVKASMDV